MKGSRSAQLAPHNQINPDGNRKRATELTVGFSWYLDTFLGVQFNYEHSWFDNPIHLGAGPRGLLRHDDALLTHLQVIC